MKRIPIILFFLVLAPAASAQRSIDEVLRQVENASRELEAQRQLTAAQKQDAATGKYMGQPGRSKWKRCGERPEEGRTPSWPSSRRSISRPSTGPATGIAKLKGSLYEKQWESQRQQLLLQAKQLCIEIVYLYRQRDLLDERLSNAERLSEAYRRKMETGDATSLEANKIAVESISARTAADLNRAELQAKIQQLNTMTGDSDDSFEDVTYPPVETLPPADVLSEAYMSGNPLLESMENTLEIDRRTVALNRGLSLPQFEIGYRHDYGEGRATGFKVGMSVPLFENKNKVKAAKAAAVSSQAQLESARTNAASQFRMLYDQAVALSESMRSMRSALASQNSLEILGKALDAGQISVIDYFTEANLLFESRGTLLQIERDYQSAVAALYSFSL